MSADPFFDPRPLKIYEEHDQANAVYTDGLFGFLFVFQWFLGIAFALWMSPSTWHGEVSETHLHVYTAVFLGAVISALPIYLVVRYPGARSNRYAIAVAQMLYSMLYVHLMGGRIEAHFHIFGSLALLAFYHDWRVLLVATLVTSADHLLLGFYWPLSVYGTLSVSPWRAAEHAAWVLFEDTFLFLSIRQQLRTLRLLAERQSKLEGTLTLAEEATASKSSFLANISHELRTPMHGILSFAKLGMERSESSERATLRSFFEEIDDSGNRLMFLLNDLLDLSKLEAQKMSFNPCPANLCQVWDTVRSELQILGENRKITLELDCAEGEGAGEFDPFRIGQVLSNLIGNAIKFSFEGTTVQTVVERRGEFLRVSVINQGVGIPHDELKSVFEKFVQSSLTRSHSGGTGLGLAICKEIVHHHGGTIWATCVPEAETRFVFEIPVAGDFQVFAEKLTGS